MDVNGGNANHRVDDTILDKIRKVQGYLNSDNPNEAAVAAAKLSELLMKHNLELADIPEANRPSDPFINVRRDASERKITEWRITLAGAVAQANLCTIVITDRTHSLAWLGRISNVEVAQYIYETCAADLQRICDGLWYAIYDLLKMAGEVNTVHGKTWKYEFLAGAANGVRQKLREESEKWQQADVNVNTLIVTNDRELAVYKRSQFPSLGHHKSSTAMGGNAYGLGVNTGRNISFKTGVGSGGSNAMRRIGS